MINIFIGYDSEEKVAFNVLAYSILKHSTRPVSITPVYLKNIKDNFTRERSNIESTEFSFSRFIVPHLMNYKGWALFMDCDQLMFTDVAELWRLRDERYAVQVCKHDYVPRKTKKFLGAIQTTYEKKNWSSFMIFNNAKCRILTPKVVAKAHGLYLHQFKWTNEKLIGALPKNWNVLAGEQKIPKTINALHYTLGGPWFKKHSKCAGFKYWLKYKKKIL